MQMPATVPEKYIIFTSAKTDIELLELLRAKPENLIEFFTLACDDETWCSDHPKFIEQSLIWLTEQFLADRLNFDLMTLLADAIRRHFSNLAMHLPLNLEFDVLDDGLPINSLLFQASSSFFHHLIFKTCYEKKTTSFYINRIFIRELEIIREYVYTGQVKELFREIEPDLQRILEIADSIELQGLADLCQETLLRYITPINMYEKLRVSYENRWEILKKKSAELINASEGGIEISFSGSSTLHCCLERITENSMDNFKRVSPLVTHLICGPKVTEDRLFKDLLEECPKLVSLDIGRTNNYQTQLALIPPHVKELVLSNCSWLTDTYFKILISHCPFIQSLELVSCTQISALGWGELLKLPQLYRLNLSRCSQIGDKEFSIIIDATSCLRDLKLDECGMLSENGFQKLSKGSRLIEVVSLARTHVSDAIITQIAEQQHALRSLNLDHCSNVTESGIVETLRLAKSLQVLDCSHCNVPEQIINELSEKYPQTTIIF